MNRKWFLLVLLVVLLAFPASARADGIIVPQPPDCNPCPPPPCPVGPRPCPPRVRPVSQLVVRYHKVQVTIDDQVAVTHVDQVFYNPNDWAVEGEYLFPLPEGAAVSGFTLWVDGEPVQGKLLDADQARQQYEDIVRNLRDPALLEYAGRGAVQAHIFPIPPEGERRIELEYSQALAAENGLVRYVYPLNTEKFSLWPLENVSINVDIHASQPIRAVYSPTHAVSVSREGENDARAGYEDQDVLPETDFALYYSLGETTALHLLGYRNPGSDDPDGFFLMLLAPQPEQPDQGQLAKDVIVVLDQSGSMEGEKFSQAQEALRYVLRHLNPEDRFNLIAFSTGLETYASELQPASQAEQALSWVDSLSAAGSTDINRALLEASSMVSQAGRERPAYLIFLTDGLPTEGVVDSQQILDNLEKAAPPDLRLFAFGVGYDVDTFLLDSLSQAHHGASSYVLPGERLDEVLSGFYARISSPVLTDLELDFGDMAVYDLYPSPLPDLFRGSQIVLLGRYKGGGTGDVKLRGRVNGQEQIIAFPEQVFPEQSAEGVQASLPRLWATRKIGYLLNLVRLQGPEQELIDQIVALSIRYGIVTPYTSYLVTEEAPLGFEARERIAGQQMQDLQAQAEAPSFGKAAVERAAGQGALAQAEAAPSGEAQASGKIQVAGSRAFVFSDGKWVDTAFDPERDRALRVPFLSDEYFRLAQAYPELASAFSLGEQVIAFTGGQAYQVVPQGESGDPVQIPATSTGLPTQEAGPATDIAGDPLAQPAATPIPRSMAVDEQQAPPAHPNSLGCARGMAPLLILPLGLALLRRHKSGR